MGKKKDIIKEALMTAEEIEAAALANAHSTLIENYSPKLIEFIKESLDEEYNFDDSDEDMDEEESVEEGTEHDLGKQDGNTYIRDIGTDEEDNLTESEGWSAVHPASSGKTPRKSSDEWKEEHWGTLEKDPGENEKLPGKDYASKKSGSDQTVPASKDPGKSEDQLPGTEVANKTSGGAKKPESKDPGKNEQLDGKKVKGLSEASFDDEEFDSEEPGLDEPVGDEDVFQSDDNPTPETGQEDFEVPDELFDDDELEAGEELPEAEEGDEEFSGEGEDDIEKLLAMLDMGGEESDGGAPEEAPEEPMGDEPELPVDDAEMADDDDLEEGLYLHKGGEKTKVTPTQYFENRISELEEEREKLSNAVNFLKTQLQEVNLFNAKLANATKLFETNLFTSNEKVTITEKLDNCGSIKEVNAMTAKILEEAKTRNPLDSIQTVLREQRELRNNPSKDIYESKEVKKLRRLAGLE